MELYLMTWPEIETYLKTKKEIILPVGSTEQHGPTGLIGTDFLTAWEIGKKVGTQTNTVVASPVCYGMALHHMAFPGSAALKPSTYLLLLKEIIESYAKTGFESFTLINGHGGNIPTIQAAFSEILHDFPRIRFQLFNWWHLNSVTAYEKEVFGEANGFHATCGEISVTMHCHPEAYRKGHPFEYFKTQTRKDWPLSPERFRETFPDGRMESDPRLSTAAHGKVLFDCAVEEIAQKIRRA
jgi:creatinine amidohydrolase